jgi:hypothetical protein
MTHTSVSGLPLTTQAGKWLLSLWLKCYIAKMHTISCLWAPPLNIFMGGCSSVCMWCICVHMCCVCDVSVCTCVVYVVYLCAHVLCMSCIHVYICSVCDLSMCTCVMFVMYLWAHMLYMWYICVHMCMWCIYAHVLCMYSCVHMCCVYIIFVCTCVAYMMGVHVYMLDGRSKLMCSVFPSLHSTFFFLTQVYNWTGRSWIWLKWLAIEI